jgi:hypothetical protein
MRIPERIYEPLPYLYIVVGMMAFIASTNLVGALSGLLLISMAGRIVRRRVNYRSDSTGHRLGMRRYY